MILIKVSLGYFFLRIFSVQALQRSIIWFIIVTSVVFGIVYFLMSMITCGLKASFLGTPCKASAAYADVSRVWSWYDGATDLVFSVLSVHTIWNAKMSRMTKFYTTLVLLLGTAGGIVSIVRIIVLTKNSTGAGSYAQGLRSGYWTQIETGMGIIAASLACLRPLLTLVKERMGLSSSARTGRSVPGKSGASLHGRATSNGVTSRKTEPLSNASANKIARSQPGRQWEDQEDMELDDEIPILPRDKIKANITTEVLSIP